MNFIRILLLATLVCSCSSKKEKQPNQSCVQYLSPLYKKVQPLVEKESRRKMAELRKEHLSAVDTDQPNKEGVYSFVITKAAAVKDFKVVKKSKYDVLNDVAGRAIKTMSPAPNPPSECFENDEFNVVWTFRLKD